MKAYIFEDAFITFRYAQNLADGLGFVFNPGERVLGTSTPLFTLILALGARLGLEAPIFGGGLYLAALYGSGIAGAWLLRRQDCPGSGVVFALLTVWAAGESLSYFGMETTLHLFLMLAAMLAADFRKPVVTGVVLGLLCLNRYDGVLPAVAIGCFLWASRRRPPWLEAFVALGIFGSWLIFAQIYFGSIFPNTLAAKAGDSGVWQYLVVTLGFQTATLLSPVKEYFGALGRGMETVLSLLFFLPCLLLGPVMVRRRPALSMLPGAALLLTFGYALIGPPARHQWYHLPSLFCLSTFALAGWGFAVRLGLERHNGQPHQVRRTQVGITWLCLGLLVGTLIVLPTRTDARCRYYNRMKTQDNVGAYADFAAFVERNQLQETSVLTHEPGFLTFQTGQRAIDAVGLVSRGIYYHGPRDRRTGWVSLVDRHRPDFAVMSAPDGRPRPEVFESFMPVVVAPPHYWLMMDKASFQKYRPAMLDRWAELPTSEVGKQSRSPDQQQRALTAGWTVRGRPFDSEPGTGFAWSRDFLIDFDELVLDVAVSSPEAMVQLLVEGGLALELNGRAGKSFEPQRRGLPVYPWRGRRAVLRVVDRDPEGSIQILGLKARTYSEAELIDDFEADRLSSFWLAETSPMLVSTAAIADRFGIQLTHGKGALSSLGLEGKYGLISRELTLEHDRWVMALFDAGNSLTGVSLWIDGERKLSWHGRGRHGYGTGRVHMLKWDLSPWKGRRAVFEIHDRDPDPEVGIAVDSIYALRLP